MAKRDKYNPDYKELYPGEKISPEVLKVLQQSDRKMKYMEIEIKHGVFRQDLSEKTATFAPTREDSLERLIYDEGMDFVSAAPSPEELTVHSDEIDRLCKAMKKLSPEEYTLIQAIFFENTTEETLAKQAGITQQGISKRLKAIYRKIRDSMKI